jgi:hypothetical protein
MTAHQVQAKKHRVIGAVQLDVPITTSEDILPDEERKLAVLRWIAQQMEPTDRWWPIFERWLSNIAGRVRGMGGDPDSIEPRGPGAAHPRPIPEHGTTGKVRELRYDCYGDFEGFILDDCGKRHAFRSCDRGMEKVVRRACRSRSTITVYNNAKDRAVAARIVVHCC